ncbi:ferredoxin reductase [Nocardia stercoris]|uniref:Ferredoxin reductase n=1 Tax=Nocardia stercoris TaxID=2483361 RepID=A0A3M2L4Z0_9NOCA|nr:FAD-binding oxidoreductase [Nocardia stercoris]RMI32729.1 ferredoxin reductase [Nocardia stercoris]
MVGLLDLVQTLTTPHPLDRYLELVRPNLTVRDLRAEVIRVDRSAEGSVTIGLRANRAWGGHLAGQYVQIGVVVDGVRHTRCYSPTHSQHTTGRELELTVKAHPHGLVSRYLVEHAAPGLVVDLAPAAGVFHLPAQRPDRLLLISGGSGITPVLSMLRTLSDENFAGQVVFLHYAMSPGEVTHRTDLEGIARRHPNFRIEVRYPAPGRGGGPAQGAPGTVTEGPSGFFGYETLTQVAPWFATAHAFVCGPAPLMDGVRDVFTAEGLGERVHTEEFTVQTVEVDPSEVSGATTFSGSGTTTDNTGTSLLEQAEAAGLTPEFGCRMGICFSCTAVRKSGCTRNLRTGELDSEPDQPIQICVNAAVGDVDIDI